MRFQTKLLNLSLASIITIFCGSARAGVYSIQGASYTETGSTETTSATFQNPDGGVSTGLYSGYVKLVVSGTGVAHATDLSDAFYRFTQATNQPFPEDSAAPDYTYYQFTLDNAPLTGSDIAFDARHFIAYDINGGNEVTALPYLPAFNPNHMYSFIVNLGIPPIVATTTPAKLHFGVSDGNYSDNTGAYSVQITALAPVPEPALASLLTLTPIALIRRRASAVKGG